jgi:hypothetical protein
MAIDLSALFGQQPNYTAFTSAADQQRMQSNASQQALLNAAIALLGQSGTQRYPVSTGQALAGALAAGSEGYNQAFDRTLKQMVTGMQLEEFKRKQRARELASQAFRKEPVPIDMATGQGSQLAMLADPMFGGDMPGVRGQERAITETAATLRANLPTRTIVDRELLAQAAAAGGDYAEAARMLEPREPKLPPGELGQFVEAKRLGIIPESMGFEDFKKIGKEPLVKNIVGGEMSPFTKKAEEELAKDYVTVRESGRTARRALSDINRIETLLEKTPTGFGASAKLAAGNLGIVTKGLSDLQAAEALINKLVPQQRPPGSGTMSDADLELYKKSVVRIINQPGANKLIIDSTKNINNYIIKEAEIANQVLNGKITREEADRRFAELGNPVEDFFSKNKNLLPSAKSNKATFLGFE